MSQAIPDRWTVLRGAISYAMTGHVPEWLCGAAAHHPHERGLIERDLQAFQLQLQALKQRAGTRSEDADRAHAIP